MEYLQYSKQTKNYGTNFIVLNLVINGIPSILKDTMGDEIVKDEF